MSASQSELVAAQQELGELVANTRSAIGRMAMHHSLALEQTFDTGRPITIRHYPPEVHERFAAIPTKFTMKPILLDKPGPYTPIQAPGGDLYIRTINLTTYRRQRTFHSLGGLTVKLPVANRGLELECCAGDTHRVNNRLVFSQKGEVTSECGIVTKPRRESGILTNHEGFRSSFSGYQTIEDLRENYSQTHRSALATAQLVDNDLKLLHGKDSPVSAELQNLADEWFNVSPSPGDTPESILHRISLYDPR
jgi:hypothetical protein